MKYIAAYILNMLLKLRRLFNSQYIIFCRVNNCIIVNILIIIIITMLYTNYFVKEWRCFVCICLCRDVCTKMQTILPHNLHMNYSGVNNKEHYFIILMSMAAFLLKSDCPVFQSSCSPTVMVEIIPRQTHWCSGWKCTHITIILLLIQTPVNFLSTSGCEQQHGSAQQKSQ
jgi:hypothetical protein